MNATELFHQGGRPAQIWYCTQCRNVHKIKELAEQCCKPHLCTCGAETQKGWLVCDTCRGANSQKHEATLVEKAKKIPEAEWDKAVCANDEYFSSMDELRDRCEADGDPLPFPIWGTSPMLFRLDATRMVEWACEDLYEDAMDHVSMESTMKLQELLDAWTKEHGPPEGYEQDTDIVIVPTEGPHA